MMNMLLRPIYTSLLLASSFLACADLKSALPADMRPSESELVEAFRQAHDRRDMDAMLRLFCWDGVSQETRQITLDFLKQGFDEKIVSLKVTTERPKEALDTFVKGGVTYRYNLPVIAWLVEENPPLTRGSFSGNYYPIGVQGGRYLIAQMSPGGTAGPQKQPTSVAAPAQKRPAGRAVKAGETPQSLVVPAKTILVVRLGEDVGLQTIQTGGTFTATLAEPVTVNGTDVIPEGAAAQGTVSKADGYSPQMTLVSVTLGGTPRKIHAGSTAFNERIVFPAGSEHSFVLLFPLVIKR